MRMTHLPPSAPAAPPAPTSIPVPHSSSDSLSSPPTGWVPHQRGGGGCSGSTPRGRYNARYNTELGRTGPKEPDCNEMIEYQVDDEELDDEDYKKQEMGVRVLIGLIKRSAWWMVLLLILATVCALSIYLMHYSLASGVIIGDGLKPPLDLNSRGGGFTRPYRRSADVIPSTQEEEVTAG